MTKLSVIKIGGNIIDNPDALVSFVKSFSKIPHPKILVHGGGKIASQLALKMGIEPVMIDGRRITDAQMLDIVIMVYAGLTNKSIVSKLQVENCNAIGLSGADANVITTIKRPSEPVDFGFVGDISKNSVNVSSIEGLLQQNLTLVFCAITHDKNGQLLNTNADGIASSLAIALSESYDAELIYCFEKKGVLKDIKDENSVIPTITKDNFEHLKQEKIIADGMLPKITNALEAISKGVKKVIIKHADDLLDDGLGTSII